MKRFQFALGLSTALLAAPAAWAAYSINPLAGFGGADGWLAPGEGGYTFLGTGNLERGLAYGNNQLYLVSRNGGSFVRRLDALTGTDLGSPLNVTGVSGGLFAVNMVGVSGDGAIYVANMTLNSTTDPFKVYRWADDAAAPTLVYSGTPLAGARVGDSFALTGTGGTVRIAVGFNSNPSVAGNNSYAVVDPGAGTATAVAFGATPPAAGDFRLGITFMAPDEVLGTQGGGTGTTLRYTSFADATGTLLGSPVLGLSNAQRLLNYTVLNGVPLLAALSTGDSTMRIYDMTVPLNPALLLAGNNTTGTLTGNANGTGAVAWGPVTHNPDGSATAALYGMSSNQGIQAFLVTVPEPSALAVFGLGAALVFGLRRSRR